MDNRPKIPKAAPFNFRKCRKCGANRSALYYTRSKSLFAENGYLPVCNECIRKELVSKEWEWNAIDKLCQFIDIPFVPAEFIRLFEINGEDVFPIYADFFFTERYESLDWTTYNREFKRLKAQSQLEDEIPLLSDEKYRHLKRKWGEEYTREAILYLEALYDGMLLTQNINGALQFDQALKICRLSYHIDNLRREGAVTAEVDKAVATYDRLIKIAEFTPKNTKNSGDFDSVGELIHYMEKRGWVNDIWDEADRDIIDISMRNIQAYNQRLFVNETGLAEDVERRLKALRTIDAKVDDPYSFSIQETDLEEYENEGFEGLQDEVFNEDFN